MITPEEVVSRLAQFLKKQEEKEVKAYAELEFLQNHNFNIEHKFRLEIVQAKAQLLRELRMQVKEGIIDVN